MGRNALSEIQGGLCKWDVILCLRYRVVFVNGA
jgi:hypothetical protein